MTTLPEGWEFDYDGNRWLYRYKANGHVQFHFPTEGDEFPVFVASDAPADLAPEERLVSQQQIKKKAYPDGNEQKPAIRTGMRPTAGPMGLMEPLGPDDYDDDDDHDQDDGAGFNYQPESFMFLGPGSYQDISPLGKEDGQTGRQKEAKEGDKDSPEGGQNAEIREDDQTDVKEPTDVGDKSKVSPIQSEATTPSVVNSEVIKAVEVAPVASQAGPVTTAETQNLHDQDRASAKASLPAIPLLDSREVPHELPTESPGDPFGTVAEMPTEQTPLSRSETHPDPVEIGDNSILAPIETGMATVDVGIAELPEQTSPVERRDPITLDEELQQTSLPEEVLYKATFGTQSRPSSNRNTPQLSSQARFEPHPLDIQRIATQALKEKQEEETRTSVARDESPSDDIIRKSAGANPSAGANSRTGKYQAFVPGAAGSAPGVAVGRAAARQSLVREASLMITSHTPPELDRQSIPAVARKPNGPLSSGPDHIPQMKHAEELNRRPEAQPGEASDASATQNSLTHVPSVLKPARGRLPNPGQPVNYHPRQQQYPGQQPRFVAPPRPYYGASRQQQRTDPRHPNGPGRTPARAKTDLPSSRQVHTASQLGQPALGPRPGFERVHTEPTRPSASMSPDDANAPHGQTTSQAQDQHPRREWSQRSDVAQSVFSVASQESLAVSDVSSLGPPSGSQSSSQPLRTPSPLETPPVPANSTSSVSTTHDQDVTPPSQEQKPGMTSTNPTPDISRPPYPANANTPTGDPANRRHSMPAEYFTSKIQRRQLATSAQVQPHQPVREAHEQAGGGQRPGQDGSQINETSVQEAATSGRPTQPVVTVPTQQARRRATMSTPTETAGHLLHPIQEQPEADYAPQPWAHRQPSTVQSRSSVDMRRPGHLERPAIVPPNLQQQHLSHGALGGPAGAAPSGHTPRAGMQIPVPIHGQDGFGAEKEKKEKGRWFSRLKMSPNKPGVLQKQPRTPMQQLAASQWSQQTPHPHFGQRSQHSQHPQQSYPMPLPAQASGQQWGTAPQAQAYTSGWVHGTNPSWTVQASVHQEPVPAPQPAGPSHAVPDPSSVHRHSSSTSGPGFSSERLSRTQTGFPGAEPSATSSAPPLDRQASTASTSTYASSVMTVDISEARAQPILRPQLVTVHRAGPATAPVTSATPTGPLGTTSAAAAPQGSRTSMDESVAVAPLFSSRPRRVQNTELSVQQEKPMGRPMSNQWAKQPVDYSGNDWGGDVWGEYR